MNKKLTILEEFKNLLIPLTDEEYNNLEQSVLIEGIRDPLIVWGEILIDGHHRYLLAQEHDLEFTVKGLVFENKNSVIEWIIKNQLGRRNLNESQRALLGAKLSNTEIGSNQYTKEGSQICEPSSQSEAARIVNVSPRSISSAKKILINADTETIKAIEKGELSLHAAEKEIKKEIRYKEIQQIQEKINSGNYNDLPKGKFEIIVIDPPWEYDTNYDPDSRRGSAPYPCLKQDELLKIELPSADGCILFLWTTHKFIRDGFDLLDKWGFEYRATLIWNKDQMGIGSLFRMQCEFCLVGIKGKPILNNDFTHRDIITAKRREHSRKPDEFYDMVNKLCIGRKLDYFAREKKVGWEVLGVETNKF